MDGLLGHSPCYQQVFVVLFVCFIWQSSKFALNKKCDGPYENCIHPCPSNWHTTPSNLKIWLATLTVVRWRMLNGIWGWIHFNRYHSTEGRTYYWPVRPNSHYAILPWSLAQKTVLLYCSKHYMFTFITVFFKFTTVFKIEKNWKFALGINWTTHCLLLYFSNLCLFNSLTVFCKNICILLSFVAVVLSSW